MNSSNRHFNSKNTVLTYAVLIIVSTIVALLIVKNIKISPDSITYSLVSQQILAGKGISVPMIWFDSKAIPVDGVVPMLMHPPLFSTVLAILGGVKPDNYLAAQLLNLICHVTIAIFTSLLMKRLYDNKCIALITGILVTISLPLIIATNHIWSDTLFIALTVAAVYFLTISRNYDNKHSIGKLFIASICTSAAISTRHAGIAILALFFWEIIIMLMKNKKLRSEYLFFIFAVALPIITLITLLARNYMVSGLIRRWVNPQVERPYFEAFTGTVKMMLLQFQLGKLSMTLILIIITLFILYIAINTNTRKESLKSFNSGLELLIIFIISYTALISYSLSTELERFELRFMYPLVPFLFVISMFLTVLISKMLKLQGFSKLSFYGALLLIGLIALGNCYKTFRYLPELFHKQDKIHSFQQTCTYNWIKEHYQNNTIIVSDEPYYLSFFGGYSTVILPHKRWGKTTRIHENMGTLLPERMQEIGARVLVLFNEIKEEDFGSYLARLAKKRENYDRFTLAYACSDGVVYQLKE